MNTKELKTNNINVYNLFVLFKLDTRKNILSQVAKENKTMFLILFAIFMELPMVLSDNVSTKSCLKIFRDEYKTVTAACLDLGFAKKVCNSGTYTGIFLSYLSIFTSIGM